MVPALAVAAELRRMGHEDLVYFGRPGSIEEELAARAGVRFVPMSAAGLLRYRSARNLTMPISVIKGIFQAWRAMRKERPNVLFAKGSYVAVPAGVGAWLARVPLVIHESDHSLGLANRILKPLARKVMLSSSSPGQASSGKVEVTGLPVRDDLINGNPDRMRQRLGISRDETVLLIFCGSQGSVRISEAIRSELDRLLTQFTIIHVTGKGNLDKQLAGVARYFEFEYLHDEMVDALWLADVVVARAGAGTLSELSALGKAAVVVPLPTSVSRGDQLVNAEAFAQSEDRLIVTDDADLRTNLAEACMKLAQHSRDHVVPDQAAIRSAAHLIATRVVAAGRSTKARHRRARRA